MFISSLLRGFFVKTLNNKQNVFRIGLYNISLRPFNLIDLKVKGHRFMNYSQHMHLKTVTIAISVISSCGCDMHLFSDKLYEYEWNLTTYNVNFVLYHSCTGKLQNIFSQFLSGFSICEEKAGCFLLLEYFLLSLWSVLLSKDS